MSNSFSFGGGGGGGGNDSSLNPLAFDSPVVRERHSRYSRLTESFNVSRIAGISQNSGTGGGLFNDTSASMPVTPNPFQQHKFHQTTISGDHYGGGGISNITDIGNSISLNTTATLQLGPIDGGGLNTSGESKHAKAHDDDHGLDMARLAIFESFYELNQRMAAAEETFDLLQQFDHTCDVNLLACKEMLERKVRPDGESAYLSKFCSLVRLERNSWRLLAALYHDRLLNSNAGSTSGKATVASFSRFEEKGRASGAAVGEEEAMDVEELVTDSLHLRLSDFELAERALKRNAALREMQIVIDWLESIYDEETLDKVQFYSDGPSYWENTLHALKIEKRKKAVGGGNSASSGVSPRLFSTSNFGGGFGSGGSPAGMDKGRQYCQQMDPDASIRSGLPLHDLDKDDENRLFHYLFRLVRAGQLQDGKEIAERQGYFWLSAALEGWLLHHDPNYNKPTDEDDGVDNVEAQHNQLHKSNHFDHQRSQINGATTIAGSAAIKLLEPVLGNPYRDLWKLTAWKCATVEGTNLYERALFAVFSGNRAVLLPLCPKWTDKLWAYFKCSLDVHLEDLLSESNIPKPDQQPRTTVRLPDAYWDFKLTAEAIFRELNCTVGSSGGGSNATSDESGVSAFSMQIEEEYHQKVEQLIILSQVEQLVDRLYEWSKTIAGRREARARQQLQEQQQQQSTNASFLLFGNQDERVMKPVLAANRAKEEEELAKVVEPNLLRFFAHLVIALRNFDLITDEKMAHLCYEVLETYIGFLIEYKLIELVAFYTLRLPEHRQVVVYATLLEGIEDETDRKLCLLVARQSNLNLPAILATVVENIRTGNLGYQMAKRTAEEAKMMGGVKKPADSTDGHFTTAGGSKLLKMPPQSSQLLTSTLTEEDRRKIAALDWLQLEPDSAQYVELLVQGNALLRAFLLEQKVDHAKMAFEKLPANIVSAAFEQWKTAHLQTGNAIGSLDIDNVVREYICHRTFFEAHEAFQKWHHYLYNSKPREPCRPKNLARLADRVAFEQATKAYEQELAAWQTAISAQAAVTADRLLAFLRFPEGIWVTVDDLKLMAEMAEQDGQLASTLNGGMSNQQENAREVGLQEEEDVIPTATSATVKMLLEAKRKDWSLRSTQLDALRRVYVPQFIFLLLSVHLGAGNPTQAVAVADIVVDERSRLYTTFTGEQLGDLLAKIREASVTALDATGGSDPLGYGSCGGQSQ